MMILQRFRATSLAILFLINDISTSNGQPVDNGSGNDRKLYEFHYNNPTDSRYEAAQLKDDKDITINGNYRYDSDDGYSGFVEYVADKEGYKPIVHIVGRSKYSHESRLAKPTSELCKLPFCPPKGSGVAPIGPELPPGTGGSYAGPPLGIITPILCSLTGGGCG